MNTPSMRVAGYLDTHPDIGFDVVHMGAPKCPAPYAVVMQTGGDFTVAQVDVEVWAETPAAATEAALSVRAAMRFANLGGVVPSLAAWSEAYVVPSDGKALSGVALRYNLPVYHDK